MILKPAGVSKRSGSLSLCDNRSWRWSPSEYFCRLVRGPMWWHRPADRLPKYNRFISVHYAGQVQTLHRLDNNLATLNGCRRYRSPCFTDFAFGTHVKRGTWGQPSSYINRLVAVGAEMQFMVWGGGAERTAPLLLVCLVNSTACCYCKESNKELMKTLM